MISCKKAAELTCAALDRPLSFGEQIQQRMHLLMCAACKGFQKQNKALLHLFELRFRNPAMFSQNANLPHLPSNACKRMKQRLQEAAVERSSDDQTSGPLL